MKHMTLKYPFIVRLPSTDLHAYHQILIRKEYEFDVKFTPKVIVDAGANIGLASMYFATKFPDSTIISIEPEDSNFSILEKNVAPYHNIKAEHAGLWNANAAIKVVDPGLGNWGFRTSGGNMQAEKQITHEVPGITIDRLMEKYGLEYIDILKLDIEGAEYDIFQDPELWIDRVAGIIIELHERFRPGCNRTFYNATQGFDVEWQQGENIYVSRENGCLIKPKQYIL